MEIVIDNMRVIGISDFYKFDILLGFEYFFRCRSQHTLSIKWDLKFCDSFFHYNNILSSVLKSVLSCQLLPS